MPEQEIIETSKEHTKLDLLQEELQNTLVKLKQLDEKAALAHNGKVFAESKVNQAEAALVAVRIQRNRLMESEADTMVENIQLKNKLNANAKEYETKLNSMSVDLDLGRKNFGESQHKKKKLEAELKAADADKEELFCTIEYLLEYTLNSSDNGKAIKKRINVDGKIKPEAIVSLYRSDKTINTESPPCDVEQLPDIEIDALKMPEELSIESVNKNDMSSSPANNIRPYAKGTTTVEV